MQLHGAQLPGHADAAVAGLDVEVAGRLFEGDRAVAGIERQLAAEIAAANAAIPRAQVQATAHAVDPDRPVAALRGDIAIARHGDDELCTGRGADPERDDLPGGMLDLDLDGSAPPLPPAAN